MCREALLNSVFFLCLLIYGASWMELSPCARGGLSATFACLPLSPVRWVCIFMVVLLRAWIVQSVCRCHSGVVRRCRRAVSAATSAILNQPCTCCACLAPPAYPGDEQRVRVPPHATWFPVGSSLHPPPPFTRSGTPPLTGGCESCPPPAAPPAVGPPRPPLSPTLPLRAAATPWAAPPPPRTGSAQSRRRPTRVSAGTPHQ